MTSRKKDAINDGSLYERADGRWASSARSLLAESAKLSMPRTREEVGKKIAQIVTEHQRGLSIPTADRSLATFLDEWLEKIVQPSLSVLPTESIARLSSITSSPRSGVID